MKKVMVTGASGFLGQAVVNAFASTSKYQVHAVISGRKAIVFPPNVQVVSCNLLSWSERETLMSIVHPDVLVHLAWDLRDENFLRSDNNVLWLEASLHLMRLFRHQKGTRFIFAGSSSEYGENGGKCTEDHTDMVYSSYGQCKCAFTQSALLYFRDTPIHYTTARYFSMYGENDLRPNRAIPTAIQSFLRGELVVCMSPNNVWDYMYVRDAAEATLKLAESDYCGIVNVASGVPRKISQVFNIIATLTGRPELLSFQNTEASGAILVADTKILNERIGYFCSTDLQSGLGHLVEWWKRRVYEHPEL